MQKVTESAFAKVNLTLAVTGRRPDGYHTLETVFQSVSLCDRLVLERQETGLSLNEAAGIPAEENIITRADKLLRSEFPALGGVRVRRTSPPRRDWAAAVPMRRPTCGA